MPGPQFFYSAKPILLRGSFRTAPVLPKLIGPCGDVRLFGLVCAKPLMLGAATMGVVSVSFLL